MPYLTLEEIQNIGFKSTGKNIKISSLASFDKANLISIGDNSRIDDFCALSGEIKIGRNVHIAVMSTVVASVEPVEFGDFSGLAFGCRIFTSSDDYTGESMTNPTIPETYKNITHGRIIIGRHVILGTNTIVFPGVHVAEGCAVGANSLINKSTEAWGIYLGSPARKLKNRSRKVLELEAKYLKEN